jgi:GNAT superfamily N-acetyltransferase
MDDATLFARQHAGLRHFFSVIAQACPASHTVERTGVSASVVPTVPDRSVLNSVVYDHAAALADSLGDLAAAYDEAGVRAWTVWVPEGDSETAGLLERAGHVLDAAPRAMAMALNGFRPPPESAADIDRDADIRVIGRLNDAAYGLRDEFTNGLVERPPELFTYQARRNGRPVACSASVHHEGDCAVFFVATLPEARGHGLATALMTRIALDAREAGCETTSLQATRAGRPIYERLGYRDLGALQMWERRRP